MARPAIGTLELTHEEFRAIIVQVAEEAAEARQAAYDATYDVLAKTLSPQETAELVAVMESEQVAQMIAERPDEAAEIMQQLRRRVE